MGQIHPRISDDLETRFRVRIAQRKGRRGDISKATEEALEMWLKANDKYVLEMCKYKEE